MINQKVKPLKNIIYLASQSPRRSYLIRKAGYECRVVASSYIEKNEPQARPGHLVLKHARGKLSAAKIPRTARFVVAADTVVALRGRIYGKPANLSDAKKMLAVLAGRTHQVYTGWAIHDLHSGKQIIRCVISRVKIRSMTSRDIDLYFKRMNPLDKAGSYAIQSRPSVVESIEGSYSNVMGLPMEDFETILQKLVRFKNAHKK